MHHIDQQIVIAAQAGDWNKVEALQPQVFEAFWNTPEGTNLRGTGISTKDLSSRLIDEFTRRFSGEPLYPGVLFVHRFQEIADDLLRAEAIKVAPEPEIEVVSEADEHAAKVARLRAMMEDPIVSPREVKALRESSVAWRKAWNSVSAQDEAALRVAATPESTAPPEETEQRKRLKQFSHLVNEHVKTRGASSIRPQGGIVTIHAGGKGYEYPAAEFRAELELATQAGLIR
jgi:hypothetical protein